MKLRKLLRSPKMWRHAVMAFFFLFMLHVAYDHQVFGGGPRGTASVEAYCPFGGLESLYQFITTGGFIQRIEASSMIMFAALLILTLIASRGFCGWICPFGSVQEWLGLLGKKIFKKKFNPTGKWDRILRYFKYVLLAGIIGLTWQTGALVFRNYDPFLAFFHLGNGITELPWAYAVLGVVLVGSLYIDRFFCKYACPLGAALGIVGKLGLTRIKRDPVDCKSCNLCHTKCPAHVDFLSVTTIRDAECNQCLDCIAVCPKPNVLMMTGPKWKLSHPVYAGMLVFGLLGLIGASQLAGKWQTKPDLILPQASAGKADPEEIRGWMTLQDISQGYGIPMQRLYSDAGIPQNVAATTAVNRISQNYKIEFEPEKVREVVTAFLKGAPPKAAAPAAKAAPATASNTAPVEVYTKAPASSQPGPKSAQAQGKEKTPGEEEPDVRGNMTLNEITLATGVPTEYILRTLGITADINPRLALREWMHDQGKSVQDVRDAVKKYQEGKR